MLADRKIRGAHGLLFLIKQNLSWRALGLGEDLKLSYINNARRFLSHMDWLPRRFQVAGYIELDRDTADWFGNSARQAAKRRVGGAFAARCEGARAVDYVWIDHCWVRPDEEAVSDFMEVSG